MAVRRLPTEEEFLTYFTTLSNWGRWGEGDRIGTLNLITPQVRANAARLAVDGSIVSLSRDMDPSDADPLGRGTVLQRYMEIHNAADLKRQHGMTAEDGEPRYGGIREFVGMIAHGSNTHLDGLAHISWMGSNYNGFPDSANDTINGAAELSVHQASDGIVTRGVLLDIPALTGRPWLDAGEAVYPEDLEAAEERQDVRVGEGDALLLYAGNFRRIAAEGIHPQHHHAGYSTACLPWLHERGVALLSADTINDVHPSGFAAKDLNIPVHCVALVAMGLWMVDNIELEELAAVCAGKRRWSFLFAMLPWRLVGVTASPVNPVAIF
jgi:kynurenine formamidase